MIKRRLQQEWLDNLRQPKLFPMEGIAREDCHRRQPKEDDDFIGLKMLLLWKLRTRDYVSPISNNFTSSKAMYIVDIEAVKWTIPNKIKVHIQSHSFSVNVGVMRKKTFSRPWYTCIAWSNWNTHELGYQQSGGNNCQATEIQTKESLVDIKRGITRVRMNEITRARMDEVQHRWSW